MAERVVIGIMPRADFKKYTLEIARGERKPKRGEPKIWFDSTESMAQILSTKNRELLRIIRNEKPESIIKLAASSGRQKSNLTRTLKTMQEYGIVSLERHGKTIKPKVLVDEFIASFGL
ncbi:MAG: MarR family transcriptional regulator [Deltaproteobacteria bacterium]|nr:MarR family transcriptional regulator [Deltaproteobacteria bacterium]